MELFLYTRPLFSGIINLTYSGHKNIKESLKVRYLARIILYICFAAVVLFPLSANAAGNFGTSTPAITLEDNSTYDIDLVDTEREPDKLTIYTGSYGDFTKPFGADTQEFVIVNNIVADKNTNGTRGTNIPANGYVLSYTGSAPDFINNLQPGNGLVLSNLDISAAPDMYFKVNSVLVPIDKANSIREANQVILYDASYGASTNTNIWGMELTVINNTVAGITDKANDKGVQPVNNSPIPPEGSVLSIHMGSPYYKQIREMAKLGLKVEIADGSSVLYSAAKINYAAYNPRTLADNPFAWDASEGKPYDGFRGPNQLIIYDGSYGERTGTNPYGYEVAVSNEGKIISTGGNDSEIPPDGYILSGHGECLKWLEKYALLGAKVVLNSDRREAAVIFTPASYVDRAAFSIKSARNSLDLAMEQYRDIPYDKVQGIIEAAAAKLENIKKQVNGQQFEGLSAAVKDIQKDADNAYYMTFESPRVENRAVWLRPKEKNMNEVKKKLDMLSGANINTIYLETFWNGYSIYPSGNKLMRHNPMFRDFDVLAAYIKEAHARGIELHAWIENFLVDVPVAEKKPEWMAVSRKGDMFYLENGSTKYYFMNPALPEVRDFLSGMYKELVRKYSIDGLQFDYMRYPHSGDYSNDFGYDAYTRQLFKDFSGTDPINLKPDDMLWEQWCEFRTNIISSYAYRLISEVKAVKPRLHISADVWPEYEDTIQDIYQDPKAWVAKDYLNTVIPMSYYLYEGPVADDITNTKAFAGGHSQVSSGIATFTGVNAKVLLRQVDAIRAANTNGIAIFEFDSLFKGGYVNALKLGAFSTPAEFTFKNPEKALGLLMQEITRKIDDIYLKYGAINAEQAEYYNKLVSGIEINLNEDNENAKSAYSLKQKLEAFSNSIIKDESLNYEVAKRICSDLGTAVNIVDAYIADLRFISSHEVTEFRAELSFKAFEAGRSAPLKVKAVFADNTEAYLDSTQYSISSTDPDSMEIAGNTLIMKNENWISEIIVDILDSFNYKAAKGTDRKIKFSVEKNSRAPVSSPDLGTLIAYDTGYTYTKLYWGSPIINSDIAGYIIYRSGREIARTSAEGFRDYALQPGKTYTYEVHGFDYMGNIIYKSNQAAVKTKGPLLLSAKP